MLDILITVISVTVAELIKELFKLLSQRPAKQNTTNEQLEQHYQSARMAEQQYRSARMEELQHREEMARMREREATSIQEVLLREADALRREREANLIAERARIEVKQRDQASRKREEEANRRAEEAKAEASKAQEQEQQAKNDLERALKGIQPEVWPAEEEFRSVKNRIQYDPEKLHFAVCGNSGSGKSSLINAFRGLTNLDPGAAPTGINETTMSVTRYPDPHVELPRSRIIWFDVPGAGTLNCPGWQYFNEQGLFVFDIVIVVYDVVSIF
jgi:hypothetical protein